MCAPDDPSPFHIELDLRALPARLAQVEPAPPSLFEGEEALWVLAEARRFARDQEAVMRLYVEDPETWGGAYISGDELLRMLPCRPTHPWLSYALGGQPLARIPRSLFTRRLALPSRPGERVLLTMGMPASGKTTLVKAGFGRRFFAVVDTPMGNFALARELIRETQAAGRSLALVLAWRPLEDAVAGMLERAMPGHEERAVPLLDMEEILRKATQAFLGLADLNRFDGDVTLDVVRCEGGTRTWVAGNAAVAFLAAELERLRQLPGSILAHFAGAWLQAVRLREARGEVVPDVLRAVAENGVDLSMQVAGTALTAGAEKARGAISMPAGIKSLIQVQGWRDTLQADLAAADRHEDGLRRGNERNGG